MDLASESKLPDVGTTIFTVMSRLAGEQGAINLSQGFPDFDGPPQLLERVNYYLTHGYNQYPPMQGVPALREAICVKVADLYGARLDPEAEVTVTSGATEALFCAITAVVRPGDEVLLLDPAYDSYEPVIRLAGGVAVHVPLQPPGFAVDWDRVRDALTPKTRLLMINTPHNPTGAVWTAADIEALRQLQAEQPFFLISDEVYEHMCFGGREHVSLARYPDLFERSFVVSSFGKTYHTTGWKVGYCLAPPVLTGEFRKIHQFNTFTTNTFVQHAIADFLTAVPEHHKELPAFYQAKRDLLCNLLEPSRFDFSPSAGTYFQLLDYSAISSERDLELCERLTREIKVASIPVSVFYQNPPHDSFIRLCFAKDDATLEQAAEILCRL